MRTPRLLGLVSLVSLVLALLPAPAAAAPLLLRDGVGLYPRAVRLQHSGTANGTIVSSIVSFEGNNGVGLVYESTDGGASFAQIGRIADSAASSGRGLCCATLFELPRQMGTNPPGTLLWAASMGQDTPDRRMSLRVWKSADRGRTWTFLSNIFTASNTRGVWEPEFSVDAQGRLVCHFADETQTGYSQLLTRVVSTNGGVSWSGRTNTVASPVSSERPGMPVVRQLPNGEYFMSYEVCTVSGIHRCAVRFRVSPDGWNWGAASNLGTMAVTVDGRYFRHAPTIAWSPQGGPRGTILLVGQILLNRDGSVAANNGRTIFANTEVGVGHWYELEAPVAVPNPYDNYCPNYSSPLAPSADGARVLQLATDYHGGVCKAFYGNGSAIGTRDGTGIASGVTYRLRSVQSGHCLDVAGGSTAVGANVWQWTCNNLSPQNWLFTSRGGGWFTLRAQNSGLCLDVSNGSTAAGADVWQWTCNAGSAQDWRLESVGRGYYRLVSRVSGHCLDVAGGSMAAGADVAQWYCNNLAPQIWKVEPM